MYDKTVTSIDEQGVWYNDGEKENKFLRSDIIVCNADLPFATKTLIGSPKSSPPRYDWDDKFDYSSGRCTQILYVFWSLSKWPI